MKKALSAILVTAMLLPLAACNKQAQDTTATSDRVETSVTTENTSSQEDKKGYAIEDIKLTKDTRSWFCPEEKYKELLETYGKTSCPGTFVVATDEDVVYLFCEDGLEKDGKTRVSQDTVFDIASLSKTFTAVSILQLYEQGKLNLDDTLDKYFPEYETGKKITVDQLLHMTSGIPDYMNDPDPFWNVSGEYVVNKLLSDILQDRTTDEDFLNALYQAPLQFEPGSRYGYSNSNYRILAFIIEKLSGMRYCDYVKKNIFDRCGMTKTTSMAKDDMTYVPVNFYKDFEYGFSDLYGYPACPNNSRGDGGIHSNLTDMIKFDRALFGGKLLNKESMDILLTDVNGYCCGLQKDRQGYSHSGSSISCSANNKIIGSEEFGHVYVIKFEHDSNEPIPDIDPAEGTGYIKGEFKDGIYKNEYAGIRLKVPSNFEKFTDSDLEWVRKEAIMSCISDDEKTMELARIYDAFFYDGDGSGKVLDVTFVNTDLAVPGKSDYGEEEYLDDFISQMIARNEMDPDCTSMERKDTVKVALGSKEYLRSEVEYDYNGIGYQYYYARKIDDKLICVILISDLKEESPESYEKLFD